MRLIKHSAIDNFATFSDEEKQDLVVQEFSKMFLLYPTATADVLDTCNIEYKSKHPDDLANAVKANGGNLKMLNRLVRLSFLVNQNGGQTMKGHNRNISYRNVMRKGKKFVIDNKEAMKEATLLSKQMMQPAVSENFSQRLSDSVETYLNLDGSTTGNTKSVVNLDIKADGAKGNITIKDNSNTTRNLLIVSGILLAVAGVWYYKFRKK